MMDAAARRIAGPMLPWKLLLLKPSWPFAASISRQLCRPHKAGSRSGGKPAKDPYLTGERLQGDAHLELQGHADHRGTPEYNKALSERRVEISKKFLVGLGIPEANLTTKAYGEEDNMTSEQVKTLVEQHPNLTQEQRDKILKNLKVVTLAQNRRVDITLSNTGQRSVRQFPFNAEDALTLLSPTGKKKQ